MRTTCRVLVVAALLANAGPVAALDVVLDSGESGSLTIVDNDGNDLDPEVGIIDFVQAAVGGVFQAEGRVAEETGVIRRSVTLAAAPPGTEAVLRNVGASTATFTVTIHSSTFTSTGSPLGWTIYYSATADDPTPPARPRLPR